MAQKGLGYLHRVAGLVRWSSNPAAMARSTSAWLA
jgi:hypothetical protein